MPIAIGIEGQAKYSQVANIGTARNGALIVDAANWGSIDTWKDKYDNAIAILLKGHESEHALSAL